MIEVKTADLIGPALDWAVAYGLNGEPGFLEAFGVRMLGRSITKETIAGNIRPSTDWSQGGPLIEQHGVAFLHNSWPDTEEIWTAVDHNGGAAAQGKTHLIAACRAIVAAKLGDTVQIPDELAERVGQ